MGDKRSYAEVVKDANKQLDGMTAAGGDLTEKKEDKQKKMKTLQSAANIPDLKEGSGAGPMWSAAAAAAAAGEEFSEAERDASSSSEEVCVCGINGSCLPIKNVVLIGNDF